MATYGNIDQMLCGKRYATPGLCSYEPSSRPNEILAIDFSLLEPARDGREQVLVLTDVFSKFTQVVPARDQQASTVADVLRSGSTSMVSQLDHTLTRVAALRAPYSSSWVI